MDRIILGHKIPAASLTLFDTLSIIILVPTYEHLLMPFLGYLKRQPTMLQRIGWGMVVAVLPCWLLPTSRQSAGDPL